MRHPAGPVAGERRALRREVLGLLLLVLVLHGAFILLYAAAGLRAASPTIRLAYGTAWTGATLVVVLRGLSRVRTARLRLRRASSS